MNDIFTQKMYKAYTLVFIILAIFCIDTTYVYIDLYMFKKNDYITTARNISANDHTRNLTLTAHELLSYLYIKPEVTVIDQMCLLAIKHCSLHHSDCSLKSFSM